MSEPGIGKTRLSADEWHLIAQYVWLRRVRGFPQRELDERIGSDSYIEKLEAGVRSPSLKTLIEWAQALNARLVLVANPSTDGRMPPTRSGAALTAADRHGGSQ